MLLIVILALSNRSTLTAILRIRMDSGQEVRFNVREHPHLDYGYAIEVEQELAAPKADPVGQRGARPSEEEQGHSLGIGLA
jgi:hypothetical protein